MFAVVLVLVLVLATGEPCGWGDRAFGLVVLLEMDVQSPQVEMGWGQGARSRHRRALSRKGARCVVLGA